MPTTRDDDGLSLDTESLSAGSWHHFGPTSESGAAAAAEAPDSFGGPSGTRTPDPLIKSGPATMSTEVHDDVELEDLHTWD